MASAWPWSQSLQPQPSPKQGAGKPHQQSCPHMCPERITRQLAPSSSAGPLVLSSSASSQGGGSSGPGRGVYCGECVVALKLSLPHRVRLCVCVCHSRSAASSRLETRSVWITSRCLHSASVRPVSSLSCKFIPGYRKRKSTLLPFFYCCWRMRIVLLQDATSMPGPAKMSKNGMVTKVHTRIRCDPFTTSYDLVGKELGRGKFAVVKKCMEKATGKQYAAKFLRKRRKGEDCRMDILNEISVLESAKTNPYVVALHEVYETNTEIILVLECAAGGEIFNQCVADNDEAFTEKDVIRLAKQILNGVAFLHRNNVVHLDLKPQNVLLTSAIPLGDIRIVDFGLSRRMDNITEVREILGTPEYVAPEILNYEPISTATDMWSIGVLTYVMLTGESPFLGDEKQETFLNISQVNVDYSQDTFEGISSLAVDFIKSLLVKNPRKRATAEECLKHPWLNPLPHPHSHPHLHARTASSLDEPETSQSESEPESPAPSPELDLIGSYLGRPGPGGLKAGRSAFSFGETPFLTLPEIQQELIC